MQPVDSKERKLGLTDLLSVVNQASDTGMDLRNFTLSVIGAASRPDVEFMNFGNTVFLCIDGGNRSGNLVIYNADTEQNLRENFEKGLVACQLLGFDEVFTDFNEDLLPFYEDFLDGFDMDDYGYLIQRLSDGRYRVIMRINEDREGERNGD
jgi:hypothetical protein